MESIKSDQEWQLLPIFQSIVFISKAKVTKDSLLFPQSKFAKCGLKQGRALWDGMPKVGSIPSHVAEWHSFIA